MHNVHFSKLVPKSVRLNQSYLHFTMSHRHTYIIVESRFNKNSVLFVVPFGEKLKQCVVSVREMQHLVFPALSPYRGFHFHLFVLIYTVSKMDLM